jgi:hypothetical protein
LLKQLKESYYYFCNIGRLSAKHEQKIHNHTIIWKGEETFLGLIKNTIREDVKIESVISYKYFHSLSKSVFKFYSIFSETADLKITETDLTFSRNNENIAVHYPYGFAAYFGNEAYKYVNSIEIVKNIYILFSQPNLKNLANCIINSSYFFPDYTAYLVSGSTFLNMFHQGNFNFNLFTTGVASIIISKFLPFFLQSTPYLLATFLSVISVYKINNIYNFIKMYNQEEEYQTQSELSYQNLNHLISSVLSKTPLQYLFDFESLNKHIYLKREITQKKILLKANIEQQKDLGRKEFEIKQHNKIIKPYLDFKQSIIDKIYNQRLLEDEVESIIMSRLMEKPGYNYCWKGDDELVCANNTSLEIDSFSI